MTQLSQFIKWQLRDFGRMFKSITVANICVFLLGSQLASILISVGKNDQATIDLLMLTIPVTLLVWFFSFAVEIQWERFKREQKRVMDNLKTGVVGIPPKQP